MTQMRALLVFALLALASCSDTGRSSATVALFARGVGPSTFVEGAYEIAIRRADIAFGPAYFCATAATSSELCGTALLETQLVHSFDGLETSEQALGELRGITGDVRTVQYDLGIAFLLSAARPTALPGSVDGHSLVIEGSFSDGLTTNDFVVEVDVVARVSGDTAIIGARADATIPAEGAKLVLEASPASWLEDIDWAAVAALPHTPGEPIVLERGSVPHGVVLRGITTNAPIAFRWTLP